MEELKERIRREGRVFGAHMLMVDSFLNQQVDMRLMARIGEAFAKRFSDRRVARVATVESSGIAPAGMTALALGVPLVVFKKNTASPQAGGVYQANVQSFTKGNAYRMTVRSEFLPEGERVLFIDDFLANGEAAVGAEGLIRQARCALAGIGVVIEKAFQPGRARLEALGHEVFALARIAAMTPAGVRFVEKGT